MSPLFWPRWQFRLGWRWGWEFSYDTDRWPHLWSVVPEHALWVKIGWVLGRCARRVT